MSFIMRFLQLILVFSFGQLGLGGPSAWSGHWWSKHHTHSKRGAVASESSICSHIGVDLIKEGGSAADAVSGAL